MQIMSMNYNYRKIKITKGDWRAQDESGPDPESGSRLWMTSKI